MRFTDYKIRTWLTGAFGLLVLLSVLSGGLALRQLAGIQANLEVIVKENNVYRWAGRMLLDAARIRKRGHLLGWMETMN